MSSQGNPPALSPGDGLDALLAYLPEAIRRLIDKPALLERLHEVVMDLGRPVQLRLPGDYLLLSHVVGTEDLEYVLRRVGAFRSDNRAGIEGTLHRLTAIRNRYEDLVGLTMRVGRHLPGAAAPLRPWVESGESLLLLGPPGSGKTTLLRDLTRVTSTDLRRRVVVVDTSNEIGGDGNVPHPAIGAARRIQVPNRAHQYRMLVEAVQNHTPEVIVIDEIGTHEEAIAVASTAERGVQLIATAHGRTLHNLIRNTELNLLVGGVQAVSSGAPRKAPRGGRRHVQERSGDPPFTSVVEIASDADRTLRVFDTATATDALLSGGEPAAPILLSPRLSDALEETFADPGVARRYGRVTWFRELRSRRTDPSTSHRD